MKRYRGKIIAGIIIAAVLALTYFYGGSSFGNVKETSAVKSEGAAGRSEKKIGGEKNGISENSEKEENKSGSAKKKDSKTVDSDGKTEDSGGKDGGEKISGAKVDGARADGEKRGGKSEKSVKDGSAKLGENDKTAADNKGGGPQNEKEEDKTLYCTLSVRCDTILRDAAKLKAEKKGIIPKDGIIFKEKKVVFYEGESVFNVLLREMKKNKIHLEFVNTPIYKSAYIEGIANIYEFDCGAQSGWMYRVNGVYPNYGSSRYTLSRGDKVEWIYTVDLGRDIGADGVGGQKDE